MRNDFANPLPGVPLVESPFFEKFFGRDKVDPELKRIAGDLNTLGYACFDFPDPEIDSIADAIKADLVGQYDWNYWKLEGYERGNGLRIQDAWRSNSNVRRIATNAKIIDLLSALYGRRAWPFQTLNFPVGTQQHYHSDSVHFSCVPERFMCGVWVALEDVTEDSGPLLYYPGSHKWPIYTHEHIGTMAADFPKGTPQSVFEPLWEALVEVHNARPERFLPRKGQALIWAANLLHGGDRQKSRDCTRWSQVTHYYFDGCAYFSPIRSDPIYGSIEFRRMQDIRTGAIVENRYADRSIPAGYIDSVQNTGRPGTCMRLRRLLDKIRAKLRS